mgnify:CR=1 FL=1
MPQDENEGGAAKDSHLKDSIESLRALATGIVGHVVAPEDQRESDKATVSPEADAAMERLGVVLGEVFEEAGKAIKDHAVRARDVGDVIRSDPQSALAQGAQALSSGVQILAKELQERLDSFGEE